MGPRLDNLNAARIGSSRAITQLILNLVEGSPIKLIDGGKQKRCFTDIRDGIRRYTALSKPRKIAATVKLSTLAILRTKPALRNWAKMLLASFENIRCAIISHRLRAFASSKVAATTAKDIRT
ncbi:hypothetical protein ACLK1S_14045 [Escherichia coli]